jgi:hypothetical protein
VAAGRHTAPRLTLYELNPLGAAASTVTWTIELDGRRHTVVSRDRTPVLQALNDEVQRVVGEALNRAADVGDA